MRTRDFSGKKTFYLFYTVESAVREQEQNNDTCLLQRDYRSAKLVLPSTASEIFICSRFPPGQFGLLRLALGLELGLMSDVGLWEVRCYGQGQCRVIIRVRVNFFCPPLMSHFA